MASYQDPGADPYGSYDSGLDMPYDIDDPTIEIIDEGMDPYGDGDDGFYISDDLDPDDLDGGYDYEYDEMYEGEEQLWDDDLLYADGDWLPLSPDEIPLETLPIGERPEDYGSQLLIGGLEHPDPALMRDSYCQFYPEACAEGAGLSGREPFNRTEVAEELDRTLKDIDMTGLAIAAVLLLILLFGLHYGGASDTPEPVADVVPKARSSGADSEKEKEYDAALKAGGFTDDAERKKAVGDIMAKKTDAERKDKLDRLLKSKKTAAADPETDKYKAQLVAAGIKEPALAENLKEILKQPKGSKRDSKAKDIIKAHKAKSGASAEDPKMADYKKRLEAAGYSGNDLDERLKAIEKMPDDKAKEKEVKRLEAKKKGGATAPPVAGAPTDSGAKKPYTAAELDKKLKDLGCTDDQERGQRAASLAKKSREEQDAGLAKYKKDKDDKKKKAELNKALEDAGMKSGTERKKKVDEIFPLSSAEQAAAIKAVKDANATTAAPVVPKNPTGAPVKGPTPAGSVPPAAPLDAAAIENKLKEKGYKSPDAIKYITDQVLGKPAADQQKELEKYTKPPGEKRKELERDASKKQKEKVKAAATAAAPPGSGAPVAGAPPSGTPAGAKPLDEAAIKKQLAAKGYKSPNATKYITNQVLAKPPAEQQAELDKYTKPSEKDRRQLEQTASKAQKDLDKAKATAAAPTAPGAPVANGGPGTDTTTPGKNPPGDSAKKPKTEAELRKSLGNRKYSPAAIDEIVKEHNAAPDDASKLALEDEVLTSDRPKLSASKKKYDAKAKGGAVVPPVVPDANTPEGTTDPKNPKAPEIATAADLDKALAAAGYSEPARKRMVKDWEKAKDAKTKKGLASNWLKPDQKTKYETRYNDDGKLPLGPDDEEALKKILKKTYDDPTAKKMVDKWKKAANNKARDQIYNDITSTDPAQIAKNKKDYGPSTVVPAADAPTAAEEEKLRNSLKTRKYDPATIDKMIDEWKKTPKDQRKTLEDKLKSTKDGDVKANKAKYGKKAGTDATDPVAPPGPTDLRAEMDQMLKDKGYDDPDAREEILDEIAKEGGTPEAQKANLGKKYTDRSEATRKKENKKQGDKRRAKKAGGEVPAGTPLGSDKLPSDEQILKNLKEAGWTDPDACQYLLKQIKAGENDKKKMDRLKEYTKKGRATPKDIKKYGDRWRKENPGTSTPLSSADKKIDDDLKKRGYSSEARPNMIKELNAEKDPTKRAKKLKDWLAAKPEEVSAINKRKGKSPSRRSPAVDDAGNPVDPERPASGRGKGKNGTPSGGGSGDGDPWLTGPQIALILLLLIPLFIVLSRGDVSMPTGESFVRLPSMPSMGSMRGPWASPVVVGGVPVSTGLPDLTSQRKVRKRSSSSSSSTPRLAVRPSKANTGSGSGIGTGGPGININNINAQGSDIPININSGGGAGGGSGGEVLGVIGGESMEEVVVTETIETTETTLLGEPVVVVEEAVVSEQLVVEEGPAIEVIEVVEEQPIVIELQGPSDPNRLFWMLISFLIISFPLILDYTADWPIRTSTDTEYLSAMMHWLILGIAVVFLFLKLDRAYNWSTKYGRPMIYYTRRLPQYVTPVIIGTVEGTEAFVWGVDDALFGGSQELLGLALAAAAFGMMALSSPYDGTVKGDYSEGAGQLMPVIGVLIVTFLFYNAWSGAY